MLPDVFENIGRQLAGQDRRLEALERQEEALGWTLIADVELAAPIATIDFTNIPADYKHLKILGWLRSSRAAAVDGVFIALNNIFAANYYSVVVRIHHVNIVVTTELLAANVGIIATMAAATADADLFSTNEILFPDYLDGSSKKQWLSLSSSIFSTVSGFLEWGGAAGYLSTLTTAINRITFFPQVGPNFVTGSRLSLYGIK